MTRQRPPGWRRGAAGCRSSVGVRTAWVQAYSRWQYYLWGRIPTVSYPSWSGDGGQILPIGIIWRVPVSLAGWDEILPMGTLRIPDKL